MLKDEDRIFTNLYNDLGADVHSAQKRDNWKNTKERWEKGREEIINEIKITEIRGHEGKGMTKGVKWSFDTKEVG